MNLRRDETELVGSWKVLGGQMVEDETSRRIRSLVSSYLRQVAVSEDGWTKLYQDPEDQRFWELTYPLSEMQGGGPPRLCTIEGEQVRRKYKLS